jgi:hypothetical protein
MPDIIDNSFSTSFFVVLKLSLENFHHPTPWLLSLGAFFVNSHAPSSIRFGPLDVGAWEP